MAIEGVITAAAVVVAVAAAAVAELLWFGPRRNLAVLARHGIPTVPHTSLLGQNARISVCARQTMLDFALEHGPIVAYSVGPFTRILVADPKTARDVLVSQNFQKSPISKRVLGLLLGRGLVLSEAPLHKRQRRIISPAFHHDKLRNMVPLMERCTIGGLASLEDGGRVDAHELFSGITLDIIGQSAFGRGFSGKEGSTIYRLLTGLLDVLDTTPGRLAALIPGLIHLPFGAAPFVRRSIREMTATVDSMIAAKRKTLSDDDTDLLSLMIRARDPDTGEEMDADQLRDEALTFLLAGHETTSTAVTWTLILLAQHKEWRMRVLDELQAVFGPRPPATLAYEKLAECKLLLATIKESMRVYPPVPVINRVNVEDDLVGGHQVPAGTTVFVAPWVLAHHPDIWDNADEFRPERFLDDTTDAKRRFADIPFSLGYRSCIGQSFAMLEAKVILVHALMRYDFELEDGARIEAEAKITLRPKHGAPMVVRQR